MRAANGGNELVSVIMPAYNAQATIGDSLASALAQTYPPLEILVVDDGSTDRTTAVVEALAAKDSRVRLLRQANTGVAAARNHAVREARGEFIATLDADDLWHPTKLAKQMAVIQQGKGRLGLVYTWYREIDEAGRILSSPKLPSYGGDVYAALVLFNFVGGGSTALIPRACLEEVGGFDSRFQGLADTDLFLRIAERYDFAVVPEYLMGYRLSAGSMSQNVWHMLRQNELVLSEARQRHPELPSPLFRWARGECSTWLAAESFRRGRVGLGAYLLLRTLLYDPAAVFRPSTGRVVARGLRKRFGLPPLRSAARRTLLALPRRPARAAPAPEARGCSGQPFLAVPPEPEISVAPDCRSASRPRFEQRRKAVAASWRIRRV